MSAAFEIPQTICGATSFCPGCGHGIVVRLIAETLEELGLEKKAICALAVGCSCLVNRSLGVDILQCAHGRSPASAAGIKRCRPENLVFTYQGDGDSSSIGIAETIFSAERNEKITQIIVNNGVYGMTGGQMSPMTMAGQKTATCVKGRDPQASGIPIRLPEMLEQFPVAYLARGSVHSAKEIRKTRGYLKRAFQKQMAGEGYGCVEILSPCPTNWNMSPVASIERIESELVGYFPLGEVKGGDK